MKWIEVKVVTTPKAAEAVSGIMYDMGVNGLYIQDPRDLLDNRKQPQDWDYLEDELLNIDQNKVIIRAYLSEETNYNEKIVLLEEKLKVVSKYFNIGEGSIQTSEIFEKDWANNWKKYYKPMKLGESVVIKPTWEEYHFENEEEVVIQMDPGMAFGTGTHETTKMCIQLLEKHIVKEDNILDLGCGSGILGITALKLGAQSCESVDIDENAVKITNENAVINGVEDKIIAKHGDLLSIVDGKYDIIIANIIADIILTLADVIRPYLKSKGIFIASGIIQDRYKEVKSKLIENNFTIEKELQMGEWCAVAVSV